MHARGAVRARACVVRARVFSACVRGHAKFQCARLRRVRAPLQRALCSVCVQVGTQAENPKTLLQCKTAAAAVTHKMYT